MVIILFSSQLPNKAGGQLENLNSRKLNMRASNEGIFTESQWKIKSTFWWVGLNTPMSPVPNTGFWTKSSTLFTEYLRGAGALAGSLWNTTEVEFAKHVWQNSRDHLKDKSTLQHVTQHQRKDEAHFKNISRHPNSFPGDNPGIQTLSNSGVSQFEMLARSLFSLERVIENVLSNTFVL